VQTIQDELMTSDVAVVHSAPKKATPQWKLLTFLTFPTLIMALMIFEVAGRWVLPATRDLDAIRRVNRYQARWNDLVESMRRAGLKVVDLLPDFLPLKDGDLDTGYDGSHYGPKANTLIAQMLSGKI
jgi:hypothetical protein